MRAAVVEALGSTPRYTDFPEPRVDPGHEIVELVATAIHPVVRSRAGGSHYSSTNAYPLVPGVDAVARTADGTLVYTGGVQEPWGTFAERMSVPSTAVAPLPDGADPVAVAAGMNPGMSSWMPLTAHRDAHGAPATVLVLGATGMAGGLAVQNALALGAGRVLGVGRGADDLRRVAGLGAETVELTGTADTDTQAIASALSGVVPTIVLDFLWGSAAQSMFRVLANLEGAGATEYVEIGAIIDENALVPASLLRSRRFVLSGSGIGSFDMRRYLSEARSYVGRIASGQVVVPASPCPLAQVDDAWQVVTGPRPVLTAE
ncbi:zinc-binding alcohol dehydrogenase family protein [Sanguibacter sp. 25GB23B1]|uniref:zinc-binding alcohol dehydrogenase family protein n=1 Tax=unclassified Sanguibacter TaxID=2645534 RepID=UPI0032AECEFA